MTSCRSPLRTTVVALAAATVVSSTFAVSLRPNKATDDSVCDLAHDTNLYLGVEDPGPLGSFEAGSSRRIL